MYEVKVVRRSIVMTSPDVPSNKRKIAVQWKRSLTVLEHFM